MQKKKILLTFLVVLVCYFLVMLSGCGSDSDLMEEPVEPEEIVEAEAELEPEEVAYELETEIESEQTPERKSVAFVFVYVDVLDIRSGPSDDEEIIDRELKGTRLLVEEQKEQWFYVITPDQKKGWIQSEYVIGMVPDNWQIEYGTGLYRVSIDGARQKITEDSYDFLVVGDWIYYIDDDSDNIYKIRIDGSGHMKLIDIDKHHRRWLSHVHNDWLIYIGEENFEGTIYMIRSDGTERRILLVLNNSLPYKYVGDEIYYVGYDNGYGIYKINMFSLQSEKISAGPSEDVSIAITAVVDGWVYFNTLGNRYQWRCYKVRTDGTSQTMIIDDLLSYRIVVLDGWIYYVNSNDNDRIYKIRTDGTENTKITEDTDVSVLFEVIGDWIYYINHQGSCIHKIRTDGTEYAKLTDAKTRQFWIVDGWIYYSNWFDGRKVYKIRTDGTQGTKLNDDQSKILVVQDGWIYYRKSQ